MFVVHNLAELFSGLVIPISPPPLPLFRLLHADRTKIVQGTRVSRTLTPQKENPQPIGTMSPCRPEAITNGTKPRLLPLTQLEDVPFDRAAHIITHSNGRESPRRKLQNPLERLIGVNGGTQDSE
jgi:hypothetical protein